MTPPQTVIAEQLQYVTRDEWWGHRSELFYILLPNPDLWPDPKSIPLIKARLTDDHCKIVGMIDFGFEFPLIINDLFIELTMVYPKCDRSKLIEMEV